MATKADKSAFKVTSKRLLVGDTVEKSTSVQPEIKKPVTKDTKAGRRKLPAAERTVKSLQVLVTAEQFEKVKQKAGMVSVSKFLRHYLEHETNLFE